MSTKLSGDIVNRRTACAVCGGKGLAAAVPLPALPLTGLFSPVLNTGPAQTFDQALLVCTTCGHGQLEDQIDPAHIYQETYGFRTSLSATAKSGTEFFLDFLKKIAAERKFRCVLDLGCNDLHLLEQLKGRAEHRVGIDPIWTGREDEAQDKSIQLFGSTVEKVDLNALAAKPDLIVCRHTLEHIYDPATVLTQLADAAADDALFVFEVPGFEPLVRKFRFDHVFHQHLHYFTLASFRRLLERQGLTYLGTAENYHDWGALAVAFTKSKSNSAASSSSGRSGRSVFTGAHVKERYAIFQKQLEAVRWMLDSMKDIYGYGAAQMLPTLAYHLKTDLRGLKAVIDDDVTKQGLFYQNLPLKIVSAEVVSDWSETSVFLTAVDNAKPILTRLLTSRRPKHILNPFHII